MQVTCADGHGSHMQFTHVHGSHDSQIAHIQFTSFHNSAKINNNVTGVSDD